MLDQDEVFLPAPQVRRRYGNLSDMALWRWLNNPALGFPQPVDIGGRRYFRLSELQAFETAAAVRRAERKVEVPARAKQRGGK